MGGGQCREGSEGPGGLPPTPAGRSGVRAVLSWDRRIAGKDALASSLLSLVVGTEKLIFGASPTFAKRGF